MIVYLLACIDSTDVPARSLSGITHAHALALGHTVALLLGERWACGVRINMHHASSTTRRHRRTSRTPAVELHFDLIKQNKHRNLESKHNPRGTYA